MDKKALIKALRDTVQSASNTVASGVSAPVDLIAAGLRKVGLPIPQAPKTQKTINPGDFITTDAQLARDYAGTGHVISQKVRKKDILDDMLEPLGGEYIYRPAK